MTSIFPMTTISISDPLHDAAAVHVSERTDTEVINGTEDKDQYFPEEVRVLIGSVCVPQKTGLGKEQRQTCFQYKDLFRQQVRKRQERILLKEDILRDFRHP